MADFIHNIWSVLLPFTCLGCRKRGEWFCGSCKSKLTPEIRYHDGNTASAFLYQDPLVKKLILQLKYHNQKKVAALVAPVLGEIITTELIERVAIDQRIADIVLVPVPQTWGRTIARGYSQTKLLAKEIERALAESIADSTDDFSITTSPLLKKIRSTKTQATCRNLLERQTNLRGAFSALPINKTEAAHNLYVTIDDVLTSGSTLEEVAKTLRKAGARHIFRLAVAFQEKM